MDALERAIASGAPAEEVGRRVEDLVQYLKAHFTSEQIAMRESAYPAYEDHVRELDDALERLQDLKERDPAARADALEALRHQLVEHVHTSDAALAHFLGKKGAPSESP